MADPFIAEIRAVPFNFAPKGWAFCNGQLLPISQNTALFSLLGVVYGGDGKTTFALPNLQGRAPLQPGQGPGLSLRDLGEMSGSESITLLTSEIPSHSHRVNAGTVGTTEDPTGNYWGTTPGRRTGQAYGDVANTAAMSGAALQPTHSENPHNNMQPYLVLNYIIALQGVFPPRW
jgi:microcystin-dependent protein